MIGIIFKKRKEAPSNLIILSNDSIFNNKPSWRMFINHLGECSYGALFIVPLIDNVAGSQNFCH